MPVLADIRALEEAVADALATITVAGRSDERLRTAVADAVLSLLDQAGLTLADLDRPDVRAQIAQAIRAAFPDFTAELAQLLTDTLTSAIDATEAFYTEQGVPVAGIREAARRSALTTAVTEALTSGFGTIQVELADATVEALRAQLAAGTVDRAALQADIERRTGTSATFARTQTQAAVGALNQSYREQIAQTAGLDHYHYYGSVMNNTRPFCRIHLGFVFPRYRIEQMRNGMLEPVIVFKGGFRCRHAWLPVDPAWDAELAAKVVDVEPTVIATTKSGNRKIVVVAGPERIERLRAQIPLAAAGYLRFYDAESNGTGFVAVHEDWHAERLSHRAGSKRRRELDDALADAQTRAEAGERVLLRPESAATYTGTVPAGTAVSSALSAPKSGAVRDAVDTVVTAIDQVHGDGPLPSIPVQASRSKQNLGEYRFTMRQGSAVAGSIRLSPHDRRELTLAHEIGHFIDQQGLVGGLQRELTSTDPDGPMKEWWQAVQTTQSYKTLKATLAGRAPKGQPRVSSTYVRYLLSPHELWARSYAQYIATRSGNRTLLDQLAAERGEFGPGQWADDDFLPVADAIDSLFLRLQWMTRP